MASLRSRRTTSIRVIAISALRAEGKLLRSRDSNNRGGRDRYELTDMKECIFSAEVEVPFTPDEDGGFSCRLADMLSQIGAIRADLRDLGIANKVVAESVSGAVKHELYMRIKLAGISPGVSIYMGEQAYEQPHSRALFGGEAEGANEPSQARTDIMGNVLERVAQRIESIRLAQESGVTLRDASGFSGEDADASSSNGNPRTDDQSEAESRAVQETLSRMLRRRRRRATVIIHEKGSYNLPAHEPITTDDPEAEPICACAVVDSVSDSACVVRLLGAQGTPTTKVEAWISEEHRDRLLVAQLERRMVAVRLTPTTEASKGRIEGIRHVVESVAITEKIPFDRYLPLAE